MTVNQVTVHPSTVSIPAPRFNLGEIVTCENGFQTRVWLKGVIVEQTYRIEHDCSSWQFSVAITVAKINGHSVDYYAGEIAFDIDESDLQSVALLD